MPTIALISTMFGQTFALHDLAVVGFLVVLEGVLSIDNALVLGLLARRLPKHLQRKALTYGLVGAFLFRFAAIATASWLLHWPSVKLLGGLYLIYVSVKHFYESFTSRSNDSENHIAADSSGKPTLVDSTTGDEVNADEALKKMNGPANLASQAPAGFWMTVFFIELTDIAFAVDSIVAAIGFVGAAPTDASRHPKLWVVITGGFIGVIIMRFAAIIFIRLLERFPRFETAAYLLVVVIGAKLVADWLFNTEDAPHRIDFHNWHHPAFWVFWGLMIASFCVGFLPKRTKSAD